MIPGAPIPSNNLEQIRRIINIITRYCEVNASNAGMAKALAMAPGPIYGTLLCKQPIAIALTIDKNRMELCIGFDCFIVILYVPVKRAFWS